jgi:hypothetical protein
VAVATGETSTTEEAWIYGWAVEDTSMDSPGQTNGYDCGVFKIINAALLANETTLHPSSYTQHHLYAL